MTIDCIHVTGIIRQSKKNQFVFGKRFLQECGKLMYQVDEYKWQCEKGHVRYWPAQNWEDRVDLNSDNSSRISRARYKWEFYTEHLQYLIYMYEKSSIYAR